MHGRKLTKREWLLAPLVLALAMYVVYKAFASDVDAPAMRAAVREECPAEQRDRVLGAYERWRTKEPRGPRLLIVACGDDLELESRTDPVPAALSVDREVDRFCRGTGRRLEQDTRRLTWRRDHVFVLLHCR